MNMTYKELYEELGKLSDQQLAMPIRGWEENFIIRVDDIQLLEERYVDTGNGYEPTSGYHDDPDFDITDWPTYPPGYPILHITKY